MVSRFVRGTQFPGVQAQREGSKGSLSQGEPVLKKAGEAVLTPGDFIAAYKDPSPISMSIHSPQTARLSLGGLERKGSM